MPPLGAPEFVGAEAGLGYMIPRRELSMDMAGVSAILVIPSIMGVGLHLVIRHLWYRIVFWTPQNGGWSSGSYAISRPRRRRSSAN